MSSIGPTTILRPPRDGSEKTFCVLGCPRGGTSMVSGLLSQMGVPMGATPDDPNQEDTAFTTHSGRRRIFTHAEDRDEREEYLRHISGVIEKRNISKPVWGWKDPISSYYVETAAPLLRNPHYVVVTRDPGAVATRELAYENPDDPDAVSLYMRRTLQEYAAINEFVLHTDAPVLVISYERALRHQEGFIRGLYEFAHPDEPLADSDLDALGSLHPTRTQHRTYRHRCCCCDCFIRNSSSNPERQPSRCFRTCRGGHRFGGGARIYGIHGARCRHLRGRCGWGDRTVQRCGRLYDRRAPQGG